MRTKFNIMKDILTLVFLILSYNFLLYYISMELSLPIFPNDQWEYILLLSYNSALFLSWVFGERKSTVGWMAYLFVSQSAVFSVLTQNLSLLYGTLPSLTLTLLLIWLFESPMEKRIRQLMEERKRLEDDFIKNQEEIKELMERIKLNEEYVSLLSKERESLMAELSRLEERAKGKEALESEYRALTERIKETEKRLNDYKTRLESLVEANRQLFKMLDVMMAKGDEKKDKDELSKLRSERKKLIKELLDLQGILGEVYAENDRLKKENGKLREELNLKRLELDRLSLEVESLRKGIQSKTSMQEEFFSLAFENLEFDKRFVEEFLKLSPDKKREFIKELFLLNTKDKGGRLEAMKGLEGVFKLKPKGGRIYFTYGSARRWRLIGLIDSEDDKEKERYLRDRLKYYS